MFIYRIAPWLSSAFAGRIIWVYYLNSCESHATDRERSGIKSLIGISCFIRLLLEEIFSRSVLHPVQGVHFQATPFGKTLDICDMRTVVAHVFCASEIIDCIYPCAHQWEIYYIICAIIRKAKSTFHCQLPVIIMVFNYLYIITNCSLGKLHRSIFA